MDLLCTVWFLSTYSILVYKPIFPPERRKSFLTHTEGLLLHVACYCQPVKMSHLPPNSHHPITLLACNLVCVCVCVYACVYVRGRESVYV